jgi:hypothetical protein
MESIVRNRVCAVCSERKTEEACGPSSESRCPLTQLFPLVAEAILATESEELEPYIQAIREHVCSVCVDQTLDGSCPRRGQGCPLDAYLPQVIDAIEEAAGRSFKRGSFAASQPAR